AGLPEPFAALLAQSDAAAAQGALFDDGKALSRLTGRPTTPLKDVIAAALKA
ncbi:MAG: NAD(P)-dependent oxidoreductase, partial [Azorhizobium sp. 32-67-21]